MDPEPRREMLQTYDALRAAGIYWSENNEGTMRVDPGPQAGSVEQDAADGAERWTSERVANALGVVPRRVGQLVAAGRLEGIKVGNMWLISAESVQDYQTAETIRRKAA
ncbi:helix-turn-helix domain-containing protein [Arthrobacter sp. FB24]|uniref:helix-turn-helix domain-containing protein n=1 Tax=Arthrobacter sp. (strain FB24) TaxID=290399 RepID=UPI0012EA7FF2|nr:helix-turn-helix domain-containing protein [Arthrobacter sp. FB24]